VGLSVKEIVKTIVPGRSLPNLRSFYWNSVLLTTCRRLRYFGSSFHCPICKSHLRKFLAFGLHSRPNARCPVCGSLERHRLTWLFMTQRTDLLSPPTKKMLHVAPELCLERPLQKSGTVQCFSADLAGESVMIQMDLTAICFPDRTFDVIYCSHVLEHIPDDWKAMREMFRVLKNGGWAIIQVPISVRTTYEDPTITSPKERERLFGQQDHVRAYGEDYYDRLRACGFTVERERLPAQLEPATVRRLGLIPTEEIPFCTKD